MKRIIFFLFFLVPGGADGPGGILVCSEDEISFRNQDHPAVNAKIPRRKNLVNKGSLIVSCAFVKQKVKNFQMIMDLFCLLLLTHFFKEFFFFLLQSEYGDLYKVTLSFSEDTVNQININYFDTVPVANSLCVIKTGFLFLASEFGNQ